jgi:hypothetical protein
MDADVQSERIPSADVMLVSMHRSFDFGLACEIPSSGKDLVPMPAGMI